MILLDSEGINAVTAEGQNDNQIFTLTVLLASVLIYNSVGVPKRNDLDDLKYLLIFVCVRDRLNNLSVFSLLLLLSLVLILVPITCIYFF